MFFSRAIEYIRTELFSISDCSLGVLLVNCFCFRYAAARSLLTPVVLLLYCFYPCHAAARSLLCASCFALNCLHPCHAAARSLLCT
jgi:hypothetical protein